MTARAQSHTRHLYLLPKASTWDRPGRARSCLTKKCVSVKVPDSPDAMTKMATERLKPTPRAPTDCMKATQPPAGTRPCSLFIRRQAIVFFRTPALPNPTSHIRAWTEITAMQPAVSVTTAASLSILQRAHRMCDRSQPSRHARSLIPRRFKNLDDARVSTAGWMSFFGSPPGVSRTPLKPVGISYSSAAKQVWVIISRKVGKVYFYGGAFSLGF